MASVWRKKKTANPSGNQLNDNILFFLCQSLRLLVTLTSSARVTWKMQPLRDLRSTWLTKVASAKSHDVKAGNSACESMCCGFGFTSCPTLSCPQWDLRCSQMTRKTTNGINHENYCQIWNQCECLSVSAWHWDILPTCLGNNLALDLELVLSF